MFTFVETRLFTRLIGEHLSDEEYLELQLAIARNPEAGPIVPGPVVCESSVGAGEVGESAGDFA